MPTSKSLEKQGFSIARMVIDDQPFTLADFILKPQDNQEVKESDVITNRKIETAKYENRFLSIYFEEGQNHPHPDMVYNASNHQDEDNPKALDQIERDRQTFVLIDEREQKIFLSDLGKKGFIENYLHKEIHKRIVIKSVIDQQDFMEKIKELKKIYFAASPDIFSETGMLDKQLKQDAYNFGTDIEHMSLCIFFGKNSFPQKAKEKIRELLNQKEDQGFKKIEIAGRTDEGFERIFNIDRIIDKVEIKAQRQDNGLFDEKEVFMNLMEKAGSK